MDHVTLLFCHIWATSIWERLRNAWENVSKKFLRVLYKMLKVTAKKFQMERGPIEEASNFQRIRASCFRNY